MDEELKDLEWRALREEKREKGNDAQDSKHDQTRIQCSRRDLGP